MIILLHTSKTMRVSSKEAMTTPQLIGKAQELAAYVQSLSPKVLQKVMHISPTLAQKTHQQIGDWNADPATQSPAIFSFIGDIYSGLQAATFSQADIAFATKHLRILSGLYGILRPLDGVHPYRLEMGYQLPHYPNLYTFWADSLAGTLAPNETIINLAAVEYSKALLPHLPQATVITPKFLTVDPKTGQPTFVVVHAKIVRGAFAHWMITKQITNVDDLPHFVEIGYAYDAKTSSPSEPVFVCQEFGGKGLSVRLTID